MVLDVIESQKSLSMRISELLRYAHTRHQWPPEPTVKPFMKALSIRQPWAWLIVNGYKDIENRTWSTDFRGRVYVHAGRKIKSGDFPEQRNYIKQSGILLPEEPPLGAIVGEVTITDCVDTSSSPWFCGPYGFILSSPVAYKDPIPYRGQLGFFQVEEAKIAIRRQVS